MKILLSLKKESKEFLQVDTHYCKALGLVIMEAAKSKICNWPAEDAEELVV